MTPDLNSLVADPTRIADVPVGEVPALLAALEAEESRRETVRALLVARLVAGSNGHPGGERLLSLAEAAEVLHLTLDWLRRQKALPFRVELSPGQIRYSARGIERWIAARMGK